MLSALREFWARGWETFCRLYGTCSPAFTLPRTYVLGYLMPPLRGWNSHTLHSVASVLDTKLYYCGAGAAFVLGGLGYGFYVGMLLQQLAQGFAEDAHAAAVDYADAGQSG